MAEKIFYTMGEVAEMFDVNTSLLRHWESQFPILRPKRNKKGNRLFTPQDVEHLKMIYHLVKECGMTLDGARKVLRKEGAATAVERDTQLMEHLQRIRSLLVEVREDLKADNGQVVDEEEESSVAAPEEEMPRKEPRRRGVSADRLRKPKMVDVEPAAEPEVAEPVVAEPVAESASEPVVAEPVAESASEPVVAEPVAEPASEPVPGQPTRRTARKPRRKKEETENKELFAFYEQSLF
ncbi:hypothetical protein B5E60_11230 [Alistipes sp. An116]|uniref:MerR family transcriptional regulator n=1 Tax=Alistipes sp. An116 TaxID=1965546 RepID=UPI000B36D047|nr:MerR family transcriptional regulator [Alistipes sp. An116]OUQ52235.1 hypothetical protein B5E60_11230 [Alistipes sp. An116]